MEMRNGEVKDFLQDVNHFLSDTLKNEHLSSKAKTERDELLHRLPCLLEPTGPYIDMTGSTKSTQSGDYVSLSTNQDRNIESKLYEEFPDFQIPNHSVPPECRPNISLEHIILPATKIRMVGQKFGPLWRKERFMGLFVERSIRCYVGLVGHHLYVYNSDKDGKPATYINIQGFEARPAVTYFPRDSKKRDFGFEVVCPGKKSYQFLASSIQEMERWITCINEAGAHVNDTASQVNDFDDSTKKLPPKPKRLPSPPPTVNGVEEYDDIRGSSNCSTNEKNEEYGDEIYYNIKDITLAEEVHAVPCSQQCSSKRVLDNDLVYDDICALNPGLYYNVSEQRTERTCESNKTLKERNSFGYDDEDIYDDIGVLLNSSDLRISGGVDTSNNRSNAVPKKESVLCNSNKHKFIEMNSDVSDSVAEKSVICADNLYEPVENPRDE